MYTHEGIQTADRLDFYKMIATQAEHLMAGEPNGIANLSNVSALLNLHLENINWVGFYLWDEAAGELVLGPFQGKPACLRIAPGRGVCGTAYTEARSVVVEDVMAFPGHIACDPDSRSEVVVPLVRDGQVFGVLDIDAPTPGRFTEDDARGLERIAETVVRLAGV